LLCWKAMLQRCLSFQLGRNDFLLHNKALGFGGRGVICKLLSLVVEGYYIHRNCNKERDYIFRSNSIRE
jgi:hypothetical protein